MKICKAETVVRYSVVFSPGESRTLRAHPKWKHRIGDNGGAGAAMGNFSKKEINAICDVLGINGREFFAQHASGERASRWGVLARQGAT